MTTSLAPTPQSKPGNPSKESHIIDAPRRKPKGDWKPKHTWNRSFKPQRYANQTRTDRSSQLSRTIERGHCHKCGRKGLYAKECRASSYVIAMYTELQSLREGKRETHTFDAPSTTFSRLDPEIYMVQSGVPANKAKIALLDSASIHTVLQDHAYFEFKTQNEPWQTCDLVTVAGKRNFRFREGRAVVILPGRAPLIYERAMYARTPLGA